MEMTDERLFALESRLTQSTSTQVGGKPGDETPEENEDSRAGNRRVKVSRNQMAATRALWERPQTLRWKLPRTELGLGWSNRKQ